MADKTTVCSNKTRKLRVFETFAGIGAQHKALSCLKKPYEVVGISEWDAYSIITYDTIHNGHVAKSDIKIILSKLSKKYGINLSDTDKIKKYLNNFTFSSDGENPWKKTPDNELFLQRLAIANIRTKNLGDITKLTSKKLPECDVLTYSFPCQDLSVASMGRGKGMKKDSGTRSGLLWEIEKILNIYKSTSSLPTFLILENVQNMLSQKNSSDYEKWLSALEKAGYYTHTFRAGLKATNFNIPQNRKRIFAISILKTKNIDSFKKKMQIVETQANDSKILNEKKFLFDKFVFLNKHVDEARECIVKMTPSRCKMIENGIVFNDINNKKFIVPTITKKQDRFPNSGFIKIDSNTYRFLTPRELFLLMGFENNDFAKIKKDVCKARKEVLYRQAGNSIVVPVLTSLFHSILEVSNE